MSTIALTMVVCNEEEKLEEMLKYHAPLVDEIVIVVQESEDRTLEIAKKYATTVIEAPCVGFCEPHRHLAHLHAHSDWQLCLDADERITPEFAEQMRDLMAKGNSGYIMERRTSLDDVVSTPRGDGQYRFYNRKNVYFLPSIHTGPHAYDVSTVVTFDGIGIEHKKTWKQYKNGLLRVEKIIDGTWKK